MPRKLLLYPERKRCRACRCYFGFIVILRQWCSEECAGVEYSLENAPRQCKTRDRDTGGWRWKQVWWHERNVRKAAKKKSNASYWYQCDGCWGYHLTSISPERWAELQDLRNQQAV